MNHYLLAFAIVIGTITACLVILGLRLWAISRQRTTAPRRVRPERAEPIDLQAERYAFLSRRDAYLEAQQLRRVV